MDFQLLDLTVSSHWHTQAFMSMRRRNSISSSCWVSRGGALAKSVTVPCFSGGSLVFPLLSIRLHSMCSDSWSTQQVQHDVQQCGLNLGAQDLKASAAPVGAQRLVSLNLVCDRGPHQPPSVPQPPLEGDSHKHCEGGNSNPA